MTDLLFLFKGMPKGRCTFPLSSLALTRSGDKGNSVNIGSTITIIFCVFFRLEASLHSNLDKATEKC